MTFEEHLEEERAADPRFRELWDAGIALEAALGRYLDAHIACDGQPVLTPLERAMLLYELHGAVGDVFWFQQNGWGWKLKRCKRRVADQGDESAPAAIK